MKLWAGFCDNKIDLREINDGFGGSNNYRKTPTIFQSRGEARKQYEDVREVEIKEKPKKRRIKYVKG